ncbi:hypothetical protein [Isoptericola sp. b408]|uniref:hypothetical protein n=1 Tax=Isoptericola sp. b408 TaxID=3064653 RepID=UPI0027143913|nr:hypothetical protein [Isoptericola sp. b408]MDO8151550.1 hypothetical protein [Isoptericola sp. b408]
MDKMTRFIGDNGIATGEKYAFIHFVPSARLRTSGGGAGIALVALAPGSAPWRHPVH